MNQTLEEARAALRELQGRGARYDAAAAPARELDWARRGTAYFARLLNNLSDEDLDAPSALPGVSRRYLEYAFIDAFGTSPSRYLRLMRLHQVRRQLKTFGNATTVTDEAIRFGFNHLSLFSLQYNKAFGESPSVTLAVSHT